MHGLDERVGDPANRRPGNPAASPCSSANPGRENVRRWVEMSVVRKHRGFHESYDD